MWQKIKGFFSKIWKWLVGGAVAIAATIGIINFPIVSPPSVVDNGETINYPYTDSIEGEDFIIWGRTSSTAGIGEAPYDFAIQNKSGKEQAIDISFFFNGNTKAVSRVYRLAKDVPYTYVTSTKKTIDYDCSYYQEYGTTTKKASITKQLVVKTCQKDEISTSTATGTHDVWIEMTMQDYSQTASPKIDSKFSPFGKSVIETIAKDSQAYFRAYIKYPPLEKINEFWIEVKGDKGGYGALDPWLTGWTYRRLISIDRSKIGAVLSNYPLLVSFASTTAICPNVSHADGYDIRFTLSDEETNITYERDYYVSSTCDGFFWVPIASVATNTTTTIYLYYGNSSITTDPSSSTAPWDSNYKGVWHLTGNPSATTTDSTLQGDGTPTNLAAGDSVTGRIGKAYNMVPSAGNKYITISNENTYDMSSGVTIQGVFYRTQTGYAGGRAFFTKNDWDTSNGYYYAMTGNDSPATYEQGFNQQGNSSIKLSGQLMAQNAWYFVTVKGSYPGANGYVQFWTNSTITASSSVGTLTLGGNAKSPTICRLDDDCKGYYDEVRISNIARSDSWINADYYGWTNSLLSFGSEESQAVAGAIKNLYLPIIVE